MSAAVAKRLQEAADQLDAHLAVDPAPALADLPEAMRAWADELNVPGPGDDPASHEASHPCPECGGIVLVSQYHPREDRYRYCVDCDWQGDHSAVPPKPRPDVRHRRPPSKGRIEF